jgi:hypothetical protein
VLVRPRFVPSWAPASAALAGVEAPFAALVLVRSRVSIVAMSAQPSERSDGHDVIHLGGEAAVVVPVDEYRKLKALERRASPGWRHCSGLQIWRPLTR